MKDYVENVKEIRANNHPHHNCAQAVLVTFAEEMGLTEEQSRAMGQHFGAGMGCGSTCGVLTGAMMAMGGMGYSKQESALLLRDFMKVHGVIDCRSLLAQFQEKNEPHVKHCDNLIFEMVEYIANMEQAKHEGE